MRFLSILFFAALPLLATADDHLLTLNQDAVDIVEGGDEIEQLGELLIAPRGTELTTRPAVVVSAQVDNLDPADVLDWRFTDADRVEVQAIVVDRQTAVIDRIGRTWVDVLYIKAGSNPVEYESETAIVDNPGQPQASDAASSGTLPPPMPIPDPAAHLPVYPVCNPVSTCIGPGCPPTPRFQPIQNMKRRACRLLNRTICK